VHNHLSAIMKASLFCGATLFTAATFAFPASLPLGDINPDAVAELSSLIAKEAEAQQQPGLEKRIAFNADAQRVSNTGDHKYVCTA
jgi:hypothetical protein